MSAVMGTTGEVPPHTRLFPSVTSSAVLVDPKPVSPAHPSLVAHGASMALQPTSHAMGTEGGSGAPCGPRVQGSNGAVQRARDRKFKKRECTWLSGRSHGWRVTTHTSK